MWCKNNNCVHYNKKQNKCKRIGEQGKDKGKVGVCWMEKTEGEY